ncbi:MAG: nucleotidyltransferase domain-containing protein [Nanoarchaeota archaeon]
MGNILEFLNKNKDNARRIFGERELKIIEKQLNGVDLTQSEKNRLSRDIREKLKFIKEIARFENEFELKKGLIIKEKINESLELIKNHKWFWKVKEVILFGSFVEKRFHLFSDIDIAVKFKDISVKETTQFRVEMLGRLPPKIDVQVYNILPDKIKKEIDKYGKTIYQKQDN